MAKRKPGRPALYEGKTEETALMLRAKDSAFLATWGKLERGIALSRSDALADIIVRLKELQEEVQTLREQLERRTKELLKQREKRKRQR